MQIKQVKIKLDGSEIIQVWQKADQQRTLQVEGMEIDMPVETAETLHAALAAGLDLGCRPRTVDEMLDHKTREDLGLSTDEVWVLAYDHPDDLAVHASVHRTAQAGFDALRVAFAVGDEIADEDLVDHVQARGVDTQLESHTLA